MKFKSIGILFLTGILFTSCEDSLSDYDTEQEQLLKQNKEIQQAEDGKWHRGPEGTVDPIYTMSLIKDLVDCAETEHYHGNTSLSVPSNQVQSYHGSMTVKNLRVQGKLNFCGEVTVEHSASVNSFGSINIGLGPLKAANLRIGNGSHLNIENGTIIVDGDLILEEGALIEFFGENNSIEVGGRIIKKGQSDVLGTFKDVSNKF